MCFQAATTRARSAARSEAIDIRLLYAVAGLLGLGAACLAAVPALAAAGDEASAAMVDPEGNEVGTVALGQLENGPPLTAKPTGVTEGSHGFHGPGTGPRQEGGRGGETGNHQGR